TLRLTCVEEGWGCWLESARHDLIDHALGNSGITVCQEKRSHGNAVFKALQITATIKGLQGIRGVVLVRAKERLKAELKAICPLEQGLNKFPVIRFNNSGLVLLVFDQVLNFFFQVVEVHGVLVNVLQEVLVRGLAVHVELNLAVFVVEVQQCIESVEV